MVYMLFFIAVFVTACSGGGGDEPATQSNNYSGSLSPATLDETSAETVALNAYSSGDTGGDIPDYMVSEPSNTPSESTASMAVIASANRAVGGVPRQTQTSSMDGTCGGTVDYSINIDEQTGDFKYSYTFKSYCDTDGLIEEEINGSLSFSGKINIATVELEHMKAKFTSLTYKLSDGSEDATLNGTTSMTMTDATSGTMTMDFVTRDNLTDKTYWVKNYVATITDNGTYEEITISGRFYHHDQGYVDIKTITPLRNYPFDQHPSTGLLQFDGAENNSARLTFLSPTTYQVLADLNGDDLFDDFDSGVQTWQDQ
jgi:hypothetical protein